jgi:hypothetical protein
MLTETDLRAIKPVRYSGKVSDGGSLYLLVTPKGGRCWRFADCLVIDSIVPSRRGLWEVRSSLTGNRISRVLFFISAGQMILLHGFIKKSQQTPDDDLDLAVKRKKEFDREKKAK